MINAQNMDFPRSHFGFFAPEFGFSWNKQRVRVKDPCVHGCVRKGQTMTSTSDLNAVGERPLWDRMRSLLCWAEFAGYNDDDRCQEFWTHCAGVGQRWIEDQRHGRRNSTKPRPSTIKALVEGVLIPRNAQRSESVGQKKLASRFSEAYEKYVAWLSENEREDLIKAWSQYIEKPTNPAPSVWQIYRRYTDEYSSALHGLRSWYELVKPALDDAKHLLEQKIAGLVAAANIADVRVFGFVEEVDTFRLGFKRQFDVHSEFIQSGAATGTESENRVRELLYSPMDHACRVITIRCVCEHRSDLDSIARAIGGENGTLHFRNGGALRLPLDTPIPAAAEFEEFKHCRLQLCTVAMERVITLAETLSINHNIVDEDISEEKLISVGDDAALTEECKQKLEARLNSLNEEEENFDKMCLNKLRGQPISPASLRAYSRKVLNIYNSDPHYQPQLIKGNVPLSFSPLWTSHMLYGLARAQVKTIATMDAIVKSGWRDTYEYIQAKKQQIAFRPGSACDFISKPLILASDDIAADYPLIHETRMRRDELKRQRRVATRKAG